MISLLRAVPLLIADTVTVLSDCTMIFLLDQYGAQRWAAMATAITSFSFMWKVLALGQSWDQLKWNQSPPKIPPAASSQASVKTVSIGVCSSTVDLPLNVSKNFDHQRKSLQTSPVNNVLCELCLSILIWLKMRHRNTPPPLTTPAAQERRPAMDCNCRLVARLRDVKLWSSCFRDNNLSLGSLRLIVRESNSTPRKVILVVGSITFPQWIANPSFRRSCISTERASAHAALESEITKKSSK